MPRQLALSARTARNRKIIELRRQGLTYEELGQRFGLSKQVCSLICRGAAPIARPLSQSAADDFAGEIAAIRDRSARPRKIRLDAP